MAKIVFADELDVPISDEEIANRASDMHGVLCVKDCDMIPDGDTWLFWAEMDLKNQVKLDKRLSDALRNEDKS